MNPTADERDALFKAFARAFFKRDLDSMYEVVTPDFTYSTLHNDEPRVMKTRDHEDVVYHHAPDATFMTYRVTGADAATGEAFERVGIERYTFVDGRIAEKDVYSRTVRPMP